MMEFLATPALVTELLTLATQVKQAKQDLRTALTAQETARLSLIDAKNHTLEASERFNKVRAEWLRVADASDEIGEMHNWAGIISRADDGK
jgi:hypothetical protein